MFVKRPEYYILSLWASPVRAFLRYILGSRRLQPAACSRNLKVAATGQDCILPLQNIFFYNDTFHKIIF